MSVSSLPEWKQLLLERKRREEEQRERREKEEEEKLASMPAWKRGIIQRRKAKQESLGDRERDRDILETIVPVHENPFIRTQSVWRKGKDPEAANEVEIKEKEKLCLRSQEVETSRGRDIELKIERFRDLTEGWEKEKSRDKSLGKEKENHPEGCEKDIKQGKESVRDGVKEQELFKVKKEAEEKDIPQTSGQFPPVLPCLRTIRADNIIIIEQDRKGSDERRARWREVERETPEEDHQLKRGMKMDLREILAGGGSVTEIRASEVLIIKPSVSPEEQTGGGGKSREEGEVKNNSLKPTNCAPTPASSPCSPSPVNSPSISPSPSPSPKLFSIRSASGGQVKRGATITITPKKTVAAAGSPKTPSQQPTTPDVDEPAKKKYPSVDEIEVIGGYQNLERSCLVKSKVTQKRVSWFGFFTYMEWGDSMKNWDCFPASPRPPRPPRQDRAVGSLIFILSLC
uniref:Phostensin/Taperin PP1-binding domain-containing protein n=1 Tax=Fundulus heteroclitus TaxID=8078 RepID=A0A3Q2P6W0_FUNHE